MTDGQIIDNDLEFIKLNEQLDNTLQTECKCYTSTGLLNNCINICNIINILNDKNFHISNDNIIHFIDYVTKKNYNYSNSCIDYNLNDIFITIENIFKYFVPNTEILEKLILYKNIDQCLLTLITHNKKFKGFDETIINLLYNKKFLNVYNANSESNNLLIEIIMNNINKDYDNLDISNVLSGLNTKFNNKLAEIIVKYKVNIEQSYIHSTCIALPYTIPIFNALLNRNLKLDEICLINACIYSNFEGIKFILDFNAITITKNCFNALINSCKENNIMKKKKIQLLLNYGYKLDYDDVIITIKKKIEIPEIDKSNIKLDNYILELCYEYNFYPSYNFICINKKLFNLQKLCHNTRSVETIEKYININVIMPDSICMNNAVKLYNNINVIKMLRSYNVNISINNILDACHKYKLNTIMWMIIEFNKQYEQEIKNYKETINNFENKLKESNKKIETTEEVVNEEINLDDDINSIIDDINSVKIIQFSDQDKKSLRLPKYKNKKYKLPKKFQTYFKENNSTKMSYFDIRKYVLDEIRKNKWYHTYNKTQLIDLPKLLKKKIGLNKTGMIEFSDIDKVIAMFY